MNALAVILLLLIIQEENMIIILMVYHTGLERVRRIIIYCLANGTVLHEYMLLLCTMNTISFSLGVQAHKHNLESVWHVYDWIALKEASTQAEPICSENYSAKLNLLREFRPLLP